MSKKGGTKVLNGFGTQILTKYVRNLQEMYPSPRKIQIFGKFGMLEIRVLVEKLIVFSPKVLQLSKIVLVQFILKLEIGDRI